MTNKVYVPGIGSSGARLMILGEAPSYAEVAAGKPFVGPSGHELDRLLKDAGIKRSDCWLTNVCKYEVPPAQKIPFTVRAKNAGIDVGQQLAELQNEINEIKPNCILGLGGTALWALTGKNKISNYRGSIMQGMGRKCVSTYHPAHLLHQAGGEIKGYWNRQVMIFDFKRAHYQSQFEELILPSRTLQICKSSYELAEFRARYKDHKRMAVDIEARGSCIPVCIGLACNAHHGIVVPLWNCDDISSIPDSDLAQCWLILAELLWEKDIIGQNFNYDRDKIRRLGFRIRRIVSDVMLKAFAINPELPKRLSFNTSTYTEEPFYKDEGMYEGKLTDLLIGCARDACVTFEIDTAMDKDLDELNQREFFENFLMELPGLYLPIENLGLRIHSPTRDSLIRKYIEWDERLRYELYKLTGTTINCNSYKQVNLLLYHTLRLPQRQGTGEEELTALLNSPRACKTQEQRRIIELILEDRRVRKTISTYLMALPDYDGRMRTTYFPCLETGRTSTGQQDPPIRPTIEVIDDTGKKKKKSMGTAFQTMTKHGDIGQDIRSMYIPDEGEIFVQADSSQAEARVVAKLSDDEETLRMYDEHDVHALTASWFFGGTENDYSKKKLGYESPTRFVGKTLRHAGHLGAKGKRASIEVNTQARKYKIYTDKESGILLQITEAIADNALNIFHRKSPRIQQVFHLGVIEALKRDRILTAPLPYGIDAPCGGKRTFFERWGDELFRQAFSYLPQRTVSDNTKAAALRIKKKFPWIKIILESHDSLLFSIRMDVLENVIPHIKKEMERPIDFSNCSLPRSELVIPCEIETGMNYQDLNKYKYLVEEIKKEEVFVPKTVTEQFLVEGRI